MPRLTSQKHLFDIPNDVTYLNCAYQGPLMKHIEKIGFEAISKRTRPYQYTVEDFFEPVKLLQKAFAELINCDDFQRIAVIPSVSYGIANVVKNITLKDKKSIVLLGDQFPSNYYPWKRLAEEQNGKLKIVEAPKVNENRAQLWNQLLLEAINEDTAVVALGNIHWADGSLFNLEAVRKKSSKHGALMIIDGTQSVGALPFDVDQLKPDALVCAGYKWLLGPYGTALAYYGPAFDDGKPIEENWINRLNSEDFQGLVNYQDQYKPKAARYSVGQNSNFFHIPMLLTAIEQIIKWGPENIQQYCKGLISKPVGFLREMGCWIEDDAYRAAHLFGIRLNENFDFEALKKQFAASKVHVSLRGDSIRIAPNVYNTPEDMERLVKCIESVNTNKIRQFLI
jgi:selenocysteine lyase/cysteine desulfurase